MKVDYLIVGQGIAGSVMALTLEQMGKSVAILSKPELSSSSLIAAGVYNPFNFRKTMPVWKAREAAVRAYEFYNSAQQQFGVEFHYARRIKRIFATELERQEWDAFSTSTPREFVMPRVLQPESAKHFLEPFGNGWIERGGLVITAKFLEAVRIHFSNRGYYITEKCSHSLFSSNETGVIYDSRIEAKHVIFCEGHLASINPYFDSRVVNPTKGELLHVSIPGFNFPGVVNGQVYVATLGDDATDQYACGATFNPGKSDEEITEAGKEELIRKLKTITDMPFEVIGHFAGVRPAGRDRKPVLGRSRNNRNFSIFNGFGSKAVLHSPFLAQMLADHLENGTELLPEINVARFKVY